MSMFDIYQINACNRHCKDKILTSVLGGTRSCTNYKILSMSNLAEKKPRIGGTVTYENGTAITFLLLILNTAMLSEQLYELENGVTAERK